MRGLTINSSISGSGETATHCALRRLPPASPAALACRLPARAGLPSGRFPRSGHLEGPQRPALDGRGHLRADAGACGCSTTEAWWAHCSNGVGVIGERTPEGGLGTTRRQPIRASQSAGLTRRTRRICAVGISASSMNDIVRPGAGSAARFGIDDRQAQLATAEFGFDNRLRVRRPAQRRRSGISMTGFQAQRHSGFGFDDRLRVSMTGFSSTRRWVRGSTTGSGSHDRLGLDDRLGVRVRVRRSPRAPTPRRVRARQPAQFATGSVRLTGSGSMTSSGSATAARFGHPGWQPGGLRDQHRLGSVGLRRRRRGRAGQEVRA